MVRDTTRLAAAFPPSRITPATPPSVQGAMVGFWQGLRRALYGWRAARPPSSAHIARHARAAFEQMPQGVLTLAADLRVVLCTGRFRDLLGLPADSGRPGEAAATLLGRAVPPIQLPAHPLASPGEAWSQLHIRPGGRVLSLHWAPLPAGGWLCLADQIAATPPRRQPIARRARDDALTGLPDRPAFHARLRAALAVAGATPWVHLLGLDRFKQINETLGHGAGDDVLREVARRLHAALREEDSLAYLGSDEFAVLQAGAASPEAAATLARRLIEVLGHPYVAAGGFAALSASAGLAAGEPGDTDPDSVLRRAGLALDAAKAAGRATWRCFDRAMDAAAQDRLGLEMELREALNAGQFELYYQPLVNLRQRQVVALEALIRWRHPAHGMVPPDRFIPLAEELGLIVPIGEWVLRTACATAVLWPASVVVAVNLSPAQFIQPGLLAMVEAALADTGLPAERLELEITENVLLADNRATLEVLHALRAQGVRIAMDDFGTGYASLSTLRRFPFDKLKIDRSFINGLGESEESGAIVRAIAALGQSLGIATTAEGVETEEQLACVLAEGCTEVQGYFFSPPRPAADIPRLLAEVAARHAA
jgi:diguanylate cyclase (GGDEF)-like protein